jgi:hypothetical protein
MSLRRCQHTRQRLPDTVTCGGLCEAFPSCLPAPSVGLVAEVHQLRIEAQHNADGTRSTAESLNLLHQALVAGLEGKHGRGN